MTPVHQERALAAIRTCLRPILSEVAAEDVAFSIYHQAGREIYEGWAADLREANR